LRTHAQAHSIRVGRTGTRFTILVRSSDADSGSQVLDQYVTMFIRGMSDGESGGPAKPDHTFPEEARNARVGQHSVHVDEDQTYRYRDASGDQMPIHVDEEFAKSVGLPGIIAHGLCTMAMCSQAIVALGADGDPGRLARLAVRFGAFVLPGNDVVSTVYDAGRLDDREVYVFEAESGGRTVITNGRGELRR
jgi:acyl dehydratase